MPKQQNLISEPEVAQRLGVSVSGLRRWRAEGTGPTYVRMGRLIRYKEEDLELWLSSQTVKPPKDAA